MQVSPLFEEVGGKRRRVSGHRMQRSTLSASFAKKADPEIYESLHFPPPLVGGAGGEDGSHEHQGDGHAAADGRCECGQGEQPGRQQAGQAAREPAGEGAHSHSETGGRSSRATDGLHECQLSLIALAALDTTYVSTRSRIWHNSASDVHRRLSFRRLRVYFSNSFASVFSYKIQGATESGRSHQKWAVHLVRLLRTSNERLPRKT